jgi:phosphoserine aminotransferase
MLTFYPGPSKIYAQVQDFLQEAYQSGILSSNHRSKQSMDLVEETVSLLKKSLSIPNTYHVFFVSSATECWEIITQSLNRVGSFHIYNGEFGKKWAAYTAKNMVFKQLENDLQSTTAEDFLSFDSLLGGNFMSIAYENKKHIPNIAPILCVTHNETSNGTYIDKENMAIIRKKFANHLIAVDATSSMAGLNLDWQLADVWFASVQKCFGLPAGLAIMVCSPKTIAQAYEIQDRQYYNSLLAIHENMLQFQTTHTPNILTIFLLAKVLAMRENIEIIAKNIEQRATQMYACLRANNYQILPIAPIYYKNLSTKVDKSIENKINFAYSPTVLAVEAEKEKIVAIKLALQKENIILGNGYGYWKDHTLRIANFPAITDQEFSILQEKLIAIRSKI